MAEKTDMLVSNLGDTLQQAQRYIFAGILSAALFILVDNETPELLRSGDRVDIPYLGKVSSGIAALALFSGYFVCGLLANSAIRRTRKIALEIPEDILTAALTHFSIVTVDSKLLRIITALLAPALFSASLYVEISRGATPSPLAIIVGLPLLASPYLFLLYWLLQPIKTVTPPVSPKCIELGNTPDEVQSVMGRPDQSINLGARVIHVYTDMKIIYVDGKVSDVQLS